MYQDPAAASPSPPVEPSSWMDVWIDAITQPLPETFERFVRDPTATSRKAYTWVFLVALIAYAISAIENVFFSVLAGAQQGGAMALGGTVGIVICGAPVAGLLSVLGLVIEAGLTQLIARALGGSGTYDKLVYAFACYTAPLALISGIIGGIPYVSLLTTLIGLNALILGIVATKAVHRFGWGQAAASSLLILVAIVAMMACAVIAVLLVLGPVIGNVFSNIVEDLAYLPLGFDRLR